MKTMRMKNLAAAFALVLSVLASSITGVLTNVPSAHAAGATRTWTGTAGDNKFSTAGNWQGSNLPVVGDIINFNLADNASHVLVNDLGVSFAGIIFGGGAASMYSSYSLDTLHLSDGAIINAVDGQGAQYANISLSFRSATGLVLGNNVSTNYLNFDEGCSASFASRQQEVGHITYTGDGLSTLSQSSGGGGGAGCENGLITLFSDNITIANGGEYVATGSETNITVEAGGRVWAKYGTNATNYTLSGSSASAANIVAVGDTTLTGSVTLNNDAYFYIYGTHILKVNGILEGSQSAFKAATGSTGTFVNNASTNNTSTPGGSQETPVETLPDVTDSLPNQSLDVLPKTIVTLDGARRDVYVGAGSTLKGTGTAESIHLSTNATIAPGHSPGKLTVLQQLILSNGSTYQAEIKTAAEGEYDQLQVSDASRTTGQDVAISDANLQIALYDGYNIKAGDKFTIINNLQPASQLVDGTFAGLAEGATVTVGGASFTISYVGGDGNDVVLTATASVTAPNTGIEKLIQSNPAMVAVALGALVIGFALMTRAKRTARR